MCAETSQPFRLLPCALQPFTFSIANGIYAGLLMSALLHLLTGKAFEPLLRRRATAAQKKARGLRPGLNPPMEEVEETTDGSAAGTPTANPTNHTV